VVSDELVERSIEDVEGRDVATTAHQVVVEGARGTKRLAAGLVSIGRPAVERAALALSQPSVSDCQPRRSPQVPKHQPTLVPLPDTDRRGAGRGWLTASAQGPESTDHALGKRRRRGISYAGTPKRRDVGT